METIKQYIYGALPVLTALPGLMAWLIEVVALVGSVICIVMATHQAYELAFCRAIILSAITTAFIGIAMLTDRYAQPVGLIEGGGG